MVGRGGRGSVDKTLRRRRRNNGSLTYYCYYNMGFFLFFFFSTVIVSRWARVVMRASTVTVGTRPRARNSPKTRGAKRARPHDRITRRVCAWNSNKYKRARTHIRRVNERTRVSGRDGCCAIKQHKGRSHASRRGRRERRGRRRRFALDPQHRGRGASDEKIYVSRSNVCLFIFSKNRTKIVLKIHERLS